MGKVKGDAGALGRCGHFVGGSPPTREGLVFKTEFREVQEPQCACTGRGEKGATSDQESHEVNMGELGKEAVASS